MQVLVRPCASPPVVMPALEGPYIPLAVGVPALVRPYSRDKAIQARAALLTVPMVAGAAIWIMTQRS
eukprot:1266409-Alexandrium_andersonii.AAC.1